MKYLAEDPIHEIHTIAWLEFYPAVRAVLVPVIGCDVLKSTPWQVQTPVAIVVSVHRIEVIDVWPSLYLVSPVGL